MLRSCDYLVIGAGAAGCAVAGRVSQVSDARVVLMEAGSSRRGMLTRIPGLAFLASAFPQTNWNFQTEPIPGLNGRQLQWNQGRLLGGSSSINGMLYMRGHGREYDEWSELGCSGWSFADVLPFFKRAETNARGADAWHGASGPLKVKQSRVELPICQAFLAAMAEAQYPVVADLNANVAEGFGFFDTNIDYGRRFSAADAYVVPARQRKNFALLPDAMALRVIVKAGRATGIEFLRGGTRQTLEVEREIILCGGAVNSPHLLLLSGIGPAEHLRRNGIEVVQDSPGVGTHLKNHVAYRLAYRCSAPVTAYGHMHPLRAATAGLQYAAFRSGVLSESYVATGGMYKSDPAREVSDLIAVMAPALHTRAVTGSRLKDMFPAEHGFSVSISCGRPASRGTVRLRSSDPTAPPVIQPNYFSDFEDMRTMIKGIKIMREAMQAPAIKILIDSEIDPGPLCQTEREIEQDVRAKAGNFWHPSGTCRMGGDEGSVLDAQLRVRGVTGLRVADTSIMPTAINACTHAPAIMIGEKAAAIISSSPEPELQSWPNSRH